VKHYKPNQWIFCQILESQATLRKRSPPIEDLLSMVLLVTN